ncbi:hypothetical protein [Streptomyces sp. NRRL F-4474]|uniref:hypothetical protein n=1 Tax=Streptomyces sp. NRRL F-4474 TaxID=1463851 RepID=UPI0004C58385|nr:hypothetical protein [Streptomyces sp. NRRL F-4474]
MAFAGTGRPGGHLRLARRSGESREVLDLTLVHPRSAAQAAADRPVDGHATDHIHIVATLTRQDGRHPRPRGDVP